MKTTYLLFLVPFLTSSILMAQNPKEEKLKTIYSQGFSSQKSTDDFEFSNTDKWLISKNGNPGKSLKCLGKGEYQDAHGGPSVVALLKNLELSDFVLEMDIQQNGKNYDLLDFCVLYGVKDTNHYSYAQIATLADKHTHNIFVVDDDKPQKVGMVYNNGVIWGINKWHHLKIERNREEKTLKVYFDDELIMEVDNDKTPSGLIGFGSSQSALKVDNLKLSAPEYNNTDTSIFN